MKDAFDKSVNNSGKKAHWAKSEIQGEDYVCSLCGGSCWYYDVNKGLSRSRFCPTCGAEMAPCGRFNSIDELIELCEGKDILELRIGTDGLQQIAHWLRQLKAYTVGSKPERVRGVRTCSDWTIRGYCPNCTRSVSQSEDVNYCGTCGQHLNWLHL